MRTKSFRGCLWWVCLSAGLCVGAHAQSLASHAIDPLGPEFKVPHLLVKELSRLVFYRVAKYPSTGVTSVFINGAYQASLQPGAFSEVCLPPSRVEVAARTVRNGEAPRESFDVVNTLALKGGDDLFVRVFQQANGRVLFVSVRPEQALPELVKLRAQQHTLTRVPNAAACTDASTQRQESITLEADALFGFGKSSMDAIPPNGRRILDHLIDRIKSEFGSGQRVRMLIVGHADSFGSDATNMRLSQERAASIKAYFVKGGLSPSNIKTDGRGDKARVITTCDGKLSLESVACNKPNRRVVVTISSIQNTQVKE